MMVSKVEERRDIVIQPIQCPVVYYAISSSIHKRQVGYCLITAERHPKDGKVATLWHIHVHEGYRREGYAKNLIDGLKQHYDTIETQGLTDEGKALCKKCGFIRISGMFAKDPVKLVWRKEKK